MAGPLDGIRVLNWSQFTPSSAGYILGDLGADVIKIEHPVQGDAYRGMGTMYGSAMSMKGGRHAGFEAVNRNQRSMTLDLKQDAGREILYKLVEQTDVFFTNLKWEDEEFNFLKRRGEVGVTAAFAEREKRWAELGF